MDFYRILEQSSRERSGLRNRIYWKRAQNSGVFLDLIEQKNGLIII